MDADQNPGETPPAFPLLRVAGKTYREIGGKIGAYFADRIRGNERRLDFYDLEPCGGRGQEVEPERCS